MTLKSVLDTLGSIGVPVSVLLAVFGYIVTHQLQLRAQRYRARVEARFDFVSDQLAQLYGPLYARVEANSAAYAVFRKTFRPGLPLDYAQFTDHEKLIWRQWAENVFIPSNLEIREVIDKNAHLLVEGELPDILIRLISHIESSKLVLAMIENNELATLDLFEPWPDGLQAYVQEKYREVAKEHADLSGRIQRGNESE